MSGLFSVHRNQGRLTEDVFTIGRNALCAGMVEEKFADFDIFERSEGVTGRYPCTATLLFKSDARALGTGTVVVFPIVLTDNSLHEIPLLHGREPWWKVVTLFGADQFREKKKWHLRIGIKKKNGNSQG